MADASELQRYFSDVGAAFDRAAALKGDIRRYYRLGPGTICLRFAGGALVPSLTPALAHLETGSTATPALTILCWDSASTHTPLPAKPWPDERRKKGYITGYDDSLIRASFERGINILNLFSPSLKQGIYWVEHPGAVPYWERSFPFRSLWHWWCRDKPFQLVHAGAVGTEDGGVLLAGKSGSGKSTGTLACLDSPLRYAGDDYVMIGHDAMPYIHSLYNAAKLVPDNLHRFPHLADKVTNPEALSKEKALFFLHDHYPQKLCPGFPIKAIFLPHVTQGTQTRLRPATAADSVLAIAPSTMNDLVSDRDISFRKICALAQSVPSYWLERGTDLTQLPQAIADFLDRGGV